MWRGWRWGGGGRRGRSGGGGGGGGGEEGEKVVEDVEEVEAVVEDVEEVKVEVEEVEEVEVVEEGLEEVVEEEVELEEEVEEVELVEEEVEEVKEEEVGLVLHYSSLSTMLWLGVTARNIYAQVTKKPPSIQDGDPPPPPPSPLRQPLLRFTCRAFSPFAVCPLSSVFPTHTKQKERNSITIRMFVWEGGGLSELPPGKRLQQKAICTHVTQMRVNDGDGSVFGNHSLATPRLEHATVMYAF
uniref:Uncharacterized protein n=1 Tax=Knipowitschia caucasica TaxID=637954 RepID=A0AAV2JK30_KNICA